MIFKEQTKSVPITKMMVWDAYKLVKRNKGSAGVDLQTLERFEKNRLQTTSVRLADCDICSHSTLLCSTTIFLFRISMIHLSIYERSSSPSLSPTINAYSHVLPLSYFLLSPCFFEFTFSLLNIYPFTTHIENWYQCCQ